MGRICAHIGITVITCPVPKTGYIQHPDPMLPGDDSWSGDSWHNWCPVKRSHVPEYVPDVAAGVPSPMKLTTWKIAAIKLSILLDDRPVTRADMKALGLNPATMGRQDDGLACRDA
jgi:hypothetical protein